MPYTLSTPVARLPPHAFDFFLYWYLPRNNIDGRLIDATSRWIEQRRRGRPGDGADRRLQKNARGGPKMIYLAYIYVMYRSVGWGICIYHAYPTDLPHGKQMTPIVADQRVSDLLTGPGTRGQRGHTSPYITTVPYCGNIYGSSRYCR